MLPSLDFYCDETSYVGHRFAAVGGIMIRPQRVGAVNEELAKLKAARGKSISSELKWEKINKHDRPLYCDVVALFFSLLDAGLINYHVVICDFHEYDHRRFNQGDKYVSVSKTYYQLLLHRACKLYGGSAVIYVWPDKGECTQALPSYLPALRADEKRRFGASEPTVRSIMPKSSNTTGIFEINDIILGAIGSHRNGRHLKAEASQHKTLIAGSVLNGFGLSTFAFNTRIQLRYTVWNWDPKRGALNPRSAVF